MMCGQHRNKQVAAFGADFVAMTLGHLVENAVGAQDAQQVRDASAAAAALLGGFFRGGKQERLKVAVAQAVDTEFGAVNGLEQATSSADQGRSPRTRLPL